MHPKLIFVHPAIRPYRQELFEFLGKKYDCRFIFVEDYEDNLALMKTAKLEKWKAYGSCRFLFYSKGFTLKLLKDALFGDYGVWVGSGLFHASTHLALPLVLLRGKKFVLFAEDWWISERLKNRISKPAARWIARHCHAIVAASSKSRDFFMSLGAKSEKVFVGWNATTDYGKKPVDEKLFFDLKAKYNPKNKFTVLYLGRIVEYKGLDVLIKAFAEIGSLGKARLLIAGEGKFKKNCQDLAQKLGVKDIEFIGKVPPEQAHYFYRLADVFVLPARFLPAGNVVAEAWGFTVNEALSCGVPVIATTAVAASEIIKQGESGFVVKAEDANGLAEKIKFLLEHPELKEKFQRAAKETCRYVNPQSQLTAFQRAFDYLGLNKVKVLFSGRELRQRRRETILNPPGDVYYSTLVPVKRMKKDHEISKTVTRHLGLGKRVAQKIYSWLKLPNIQYIRGKYLKDIDVVHTPGHLLMNHKPYVVEVDNPACLARYDLGVFEKRKGWIEKFLKGRYCKRIICISQAAKKSMAVYFPADILDKCEVVYPYVKINHFQKSSNLDKVVLLSCNTKFYMKGTREVLLAYEELRKKHRNLELWIVSNTPREYLEKYKDYGDIKFFEAKYSKDELYEKFYSQCDIFVQPSYQDSFGLVYLEVLASGKPVVTTDLYAIPEMVKDGCNGFLLKSPVYMYNPDFTLKPEYFPMRCQDTEKEFYKKIDGREVVARLVEKLGILIADQELRLRMGACALEGVREKFNEQNRKSLLKLIYSEAYGEH